MPFVRRGDIEDERERLIIACPHSRSDDVVSARSLVPRQDQRGERLTLFVAEIGEDITIGSAFWTDSLVT